MFSKELYTVLTYSFSAFLIVIYSGILYKFIYMRKAAISYVLSIILIALSVFTIADSATGNKTTPISFLIQGISLAQDDELAKMIEGGEYTLYYSVPFKIYTSEHNFDIYQNYDKSKVILSTYYSEYRISDEYLVLDKISSSNLLFSTPEILTCFAGFENDMFSYYRIHNPDSYEPFHLFEIDGIIYEALEENNKPTLSEILSDNEYNFVNRSLEPLFEQMESQDEHTKMYSELAISSLDELEGYELQILDNEGNEVIERLPLTKENLLNDELLNMGRLYNSKVVTVFDEFQVRLRYEVPLFYFDDFESDIFIPLVLSEGKAKAISGYGATILKNQLSLSEDTIFVEQFVDIDNIVYSLVELGELNEDEFVSKEQYLIPTDFSRILKPTTPISFEEEYKGHFTLNLDEIETSLVEDITLNEEEISLLLKDPLIVLNGMQFRGRGSLTFN